MIAHDVMSAQWRADRPRSDQGKGVDRSRRCQGADGLTTRCHYNAAMDRKPPPRLVPPRALRTKPPGSRPAPRLPKGTPPKGSPPPRPVAERPHPRTPAFVRDSSRGTFEDLFALFPDLPRPPRPAPRVRLARPRVRRLR